MPEVGTGFDASYVDRNQTKSVTDIESASRTAATPQSVKLLGDKLDEIGRVNPPPEAPSYGVAKPRRFVIRGTVTRNEDQ